MNALIAQIDRRSLVKATAVYLLIYAVLNVCAGLAMTVLGGLTGVLGAASAGMFEQSAAMGIEGSEEALAAMSEATTFGGLAIVWGILALLSVPLLLVVAYGLFQRRAWARMGAVVALGVTILLSVINFGSIGVSSLLWIIVSGFVLYLFMTDEGVRRELSA